VAKLALQSSQKPRRDLVTIDHLRALHRYLDHTNAFNIAVFTIVCITFWSCCRLGELLINTKPDPKAHILQSMSIRHGVAANRMKFINFDVPHTKTKADGDTINLSDSDAIAVLSVPSNIM